MQSAATCKRKGLQGLWCRARVAAGLVLLLTTIVACGGSGDGNTPPPLAPINTLAYVDTACRDGADGFSMTQELRVRRGDNAPVTIARVAIGPLQVPLSYCGLFGRTRNGTELLTIGAFQRLSVSPDGAAVLFEVTDDFSLLRQSFLSPEQKGIFFIRADGSGLRRLGDASRIPPITPVGYADPVFWFTPNGSLVDFTDMGPGPGGEDATQVFILDVETGERTQVTHLPPAPLAGLDGTDAGSFLNDRTIVFSTTSNPDGHNPLKRSLRYTVSIDGSELKALPTVELPGGGLVPVPVITGFGRLVLEVNFEVFITDGTDVLQLTNFRRLDTALVTSLLSVDGDRVFLTASANPPPGPNDPPLGTNPLEVCQVFSVDAPGGDLRQLTHFSASRHSTLGCAAQRPSEGCRTDFAFNQKVSQDTRTGTLVFVSSCDPFGTSPDGEQIFAMRPDGTGLHALTDAHSVVRNPDGSVEAELPGPWAYGPHR